MQEPLIAGTLEAQTVEPRSSVEIKQNAKGEPSTSVKAYSAEGETLDETADRAIATYRKVVEEVGA